MPTGIIAGLAIKPTNKAPMQLAEECFIGLDGIEGNAPQSAKRRVTLLSREQWKETMEELGCDLPWTTRRANMLIAGLDLPATIGSRLQIGEAVLQVEGETTPCGLMDQYQPGLEAALTPERRGGVHCRVLAPGAVRVGDVATLLGDSL